MESLKKRFDILLKKYEARKSFFVNKVERWGKKRNKKWYLQGKELLQVLEKESGQLKEMFVNAEGIVKKTLKTKLKDFKKAYKQIHEATKPEWRQWIEALVIAGVIAFVLRSFLFGLYHVPTGSAEPTVLVGDRVWGNKLAYMFGDKPARGDLVIFDEPRFKYSKSSWVQNAWQKYVGIPVSLLGLEAGPINVVKRVIACPGDKIEGRVEEGKPVIYLNEKKLDEPYVNPYPLILLVKSTGFISLKSIGPFVIPSFLRLTYVPVQYTYVPEKSFEKQPFYNIKKSEIISPILTKPYTSCYKDQEKTCNADVFGPFRINKGKYWVMGDSRKNSQDSRWFGFLDEKLIHGRLSFIIFSIDSQEPFWLLELIKHPIDFWFKYVRWNRFFKKPVLVTREK